MRRALVLLAITVVVLALLLRAGCDGDPAAPVATDGGAASDAATPPVRPAAERPRTPRAARPVEPEAPAGEPAPTATEPVPGPAATVAAPAPGGPLPEGEIPDADRGTGDCVLALDLRDTATDRPYEGRIRIWRLGVPGDAKWPAGDHVQRTIDTGRDPRQATVADLPAGRYRLELLGAAPGEPDPPAFDVAGPRTDLRLQVAAPALHAARVRLLDENGNPVTTAFLRRGPSGGNTPMPMRAPDWAAPRNPLPPYLALGRGGGWRRMMSGGGERRAEAGPDGAFELDVIRAAGRQQTWAVTWTLRPEGRTAVRADFRSEDAGKGDLVGVSVPVARFEDVVVRLPDGRLAREAGASFDFAGSAVAVPADARLTAWRTIPIRLTVRLSGFEDLTAEWRVGDPLPGPFTMQPVPPKQE